MTDVIVWLLLQFWYTALLPAPRPARDPTGPLPARMYAVAGDYEHSGSDPISSIRLRAHFDHPTLASFRPKAASQTAPCLMAASTVVARRNATSRSAQNRSSRIIAPRMGDA